MQIYNNLYPSHTSSSTCSQWNLPYTNTFHFSGYNRPSLFHCTSANIVSYSSLRTRTVDTGAGTFCPRNPDYIYKFLELDHMSRIFRICTFDHSFYRKGHLDSRFHRVCRKRLFDKCIYRLFESTWKAGTWKMVGWLFRIFEKCRKIKSKSKWFRFEIFERNCHMGDIVWQFVNQIFRNCRPVKFKF